jgi:hypothetical protein
MAFNAKQKGVVKHAGTGAAIVAAALFASFLLPSKFLPDDQTAPRIAWGLQWGLLPILTLMVSIMRVANYRFSSAEDIDGSGLTVGGAQINILRAVLQNTLEQSVLALTAYTVGAVSFPHAWLCVIPAAALLFVIGRICFAVGYAGGAGGRALGFGMTAYPTFGLLIAAAVVLLFRALGF